MKILYSILLISLFFSCNNEPPKSNDVISKIEFIELIKSIHLIEAKYEVQKNKNNVTAKHQLRVEYDSIFNSYKLKVEDFEKSIKFYSTDSNELDEIYDLAIEGLINEKKKSLNIN
tara:strand:- start:26636 stop:26983 length:348 start_codon:yes stop_codon:yes gene_type:complete